MVFAQSNHGGRSRGDCGLHSATVGRVANPPSEIRPKGFSINRDQAEGLLTQHKSSRTFAHAQRVYKNKTAPKGHGRTLVAGGTSPSSPIFRLLSDFLLPQRFAAPHQDLRERGRAPPEGQAWNSRMGGLAVVETFVNLISFFRISPRSSAISNAYQNTLPGKALFKAPCFQSVRL